MSGPDKETPKKPADPGASSGSGATSSSGASSGSSNGNGSDNGNGSGGSASTAQATAAVSSAVNVVRERLVAGEQLVLSAALAIVVVVFFIFDFLLDYHLISSFTVVIAVLTVLAIWVHRWGHYDFGNGYRLVVGALGISLALFAVLSLLAWARMGGGAGDFLRLIGLIIYWISGIAAGYGAWLVFRVREEE
jgi:hypothetical protein